MGKNNQDPLADDLAQLFSLSDGVLERMVGLINDGRGDALVERFKEIGGFDTITMAKRYLATLSVGIHLFKSHERQWDSLLQSLELSKSGRDRITKIVKQLDDNGVDRLYSKFHNDADISNSPIMINMGKDVFLREILDLVMTDRLKDSGACCTGQTAIQRHACRCHAMVGNYIHV